MDSSQWMSDDSAGRGSLDQGHKDSRGRDIGSRFRDFHYQYRAAGEIMARGYRTPKLVVEAWMQSPGHKRILLSRDYKEVGSGYSERGAQETNDYWCVDFGSR